MLELIEQHREQIAALCRKYRVRRLELFGSAAGDAFDPATSDIDFFYEFFSGDTDRLADRYFSFHEELERLLGRPVDLVSSKDASNPYFLRVANRSRIMLYAA